MKLKLTKTLALGAVSLFTLSVARAATITWIGQGTISDNTFLSLAGTTANEVYGVNFGAGSLTTGNGYTFTDYTAGNFSIAGGGGSFFNGYLNGQTSGDANLNTMLADGHYGNTIDNSGTLLNLQIGLTYNVVAFIDDNRAGAAGGTQFRVNDGTANSPTQLYGTFGSTAGSPLGGYLLGTFTADATTQVLTVNNNGQDGSFAGNNAQFNGILLAVAPVPEPTTLALVGGGLTLMLALRFKKSSNAV